MQLLDCCAIDPENLIYKQRLIVVSFMYIILGKSFEQFTLRKIIDEFPHSSCYLLSPKYAINDLYSDFLRNCCGFELSDLLPFIQYASSYFEMPISKDYPSIVKSDRERVMSVRKLIFYFLEFL